METSDGGGGHVRRWLLRLTVVTESNEDNSGLEGGWSQAHEQLVVEVRGRDGGYVAKHHLVTSSEAVANTGHFGTTDSWTLSRD